jgi:hypothetical protein
MELLLIRTYDVLGTNGTVYNCEKSICHTIELPWKENQKMISCIPEGRYEIVKRYNTKFKWHFIVMNVPNRSFILIHPANDALKELKGCIAPVLVLAAAGKGYESKKALKSLISIIYPLLNQKEKIYLTIKSKPNNETH